MEKDRYRSVEKDISDLCLVHKDGKNDVSPICKSYRFFCLHFFSRCSFFKFAFHFFFSITLKYFELVATSW